MSPIEEYFEWDVHHWSKAIPVWEKVLEGKAYNAALELGSRSGGLSLWLAERYNVKVICSDIQSPEMAAKERYKGHTLKGQITFDSLDILKIAYPSNSFDIVVFKSVLGALGSFSNQQLAMQEIYRILKPGGVLLFAENLKSSRLHAFARKIFVPWGARWCYLNVNEINALTFPFVEKEIQTAGFISILLPNKIKNMGYIFDDWLDRNNYFSRLKYICFGYAIK